MSTILVSLRAIPPMYTCDPLARVNYPSTPRDECRRRGAVGMMPVREHCWDATTDIAARLGELERSLPLKPPGRNRKTDLLSLGALPWPSR